MSAELVVQCHDNRVVLELNRPHKRNALSGDLVEALIKAVEEAESDGARLLIFRGVGKNFSAGFDFTGWQEQSEGDIVLRFIRIEILLQKIAYSSMVTVALAHGRNFGAAVDLFAACDHRIAASDTTFRMPGLAFGLVLGTRRFAACVGQAAARSILAPGRTFDVAEAGSLGFVTRCLEPSAWRLAVDEVPITSADWGVELLEGALQTGQPDIEMTELVRSAAKPGLKERIDEYLTSYS